MCPLSPLRCKRNGAKDAKRGLGPYHVSETRHGPPASVQDYCMHVEQTSTMTHVMKGGENWSHLGASRGKQDFGLL